LSPLRLPVPPCRHYLQVPDFTTFAGDSRTMSPLPSHKKAPARNSTTSLRAATFDFTRSGRLGVCELIAERRQELRLPVPLKHSCQFAISRTAPEQQIFPRRSLQIENCFSVRLRVKLSAPPARARPPVVFSPARLGSSRRAQFPRLHSLFRERSRRRCGRLPE
jgi:hypothetical protein